MLKHPEIPKEPTGSPSMEHRSLEPHLLQQAGYAVPLGNLQKARHI